MSDQEGERAGARQPGTKRAEPVTREAVEWGFRLLAGREAISQSEVNGFLALPNMVALRRTFSNTHEFHAFFDAFHTGHEAWTMPLFLLRPPTAEGIEWRFTPPDLEAPGCQLCTTSQFKDQAFAEIAGAMGLATGVSRFRWQQVWIVSVLATEGFIAAGKRGLGLQLDNDRISALLASRGCEVLATAAADPGGLGAADRRLRLFYPEVIHIEEFDRLVRFAELEPRSVGELAAQSVDFVWSIGMPGRLGTVDAALDFFEASTRPLRPGGIALHTFDFNLTSNRSTWEQPGNVVLRLRDIEALAERLRPSGCRLLPLTTHPGHDIADEKVRGAIGGAPGLRQRVGMMVTTSFGLAIRKAE
jgi:hypothetical protein